MSKFEYVMVLVSIILGLGIAQILAGVAKIIKRWSRIKIYIPHLLCVFVVFGIHIQEWWVNYEFLKIIHEWRFSTFFILISFSTVLFIMAKLLFPIRFKGEDKDFKVFYFREFHRMFFMGILLIIIACIQNIVLFNEGILEQYVLFIIGGGFAYLIFSRTKNEYIHYGMGIGMFLLGIAYIIIKDPVLN